MQQWSTLIKQLSIHKTQLPIQFEMARSGGLGGGGRGKDSYVPPIDMYRRKIGKQDSKKEKVHLKEVKLKQEAKEMAPRAYREAVRSLFSDYQTESSRKLITGLQFFFFSSSSCQAWCSWLLECMESSTSPLESEPTHPKLDLWCSNFYIRL